MEFILDFQGFKNENNEFIIKELAVLSTDEQVSEHLLFRPPYSYHKLPEKVKAQVSWLEKCFHGLSWNSGLKDFDVLNDVLKDVFKLGGTVYVKGSEKYKFIHGLLSGIEIKVLDIEDFDCPGLPVLKKTWALSNVKSCPFNHSSENCAYYNVKLILEWWKMEQLMMGRMETVNLAIKDCVSNGYKRMSSDLVKYLPKDFVLNYHEDIEEIFDKLPQKLQDDEEINGCKRCDKHFQWPAVSGSDCWDGKNPKRKHCYFCKAETLGVKSMDTV